MKYEMVMPKMGESITEGTILKWLKGRGQSVTKDEIILEISTDKVDSEIPTPVAGTIVELIAAEGDTIEVGLPIAVIETDSDATPASEPQKKEIAATQPDEAPGTEIPEKKPRVKGTRFYSPVVLNIAAENHLSMDQLDQIEGSGLNGRLTRKDLLAYLEKQTAITESLPGQATSAGPVEILTMDNMRKSIARHMIQSKQTSAHVNLFTEVDMRNIALILERNKSAFKSREGFSLTYTPFIVQATVTALQEFPLINASIDGESILVKKYYNIGIAVAVENGLIVPNLFKADEKSLIGLARGINDLALRARGKKLQPDELANGTFSISNFGVFGTSAGFPIINQPQVAILGVGAVKKRAVVINDAIAIRPIMYLALTIDHRLIDGAMGAQFLERIRQLLEEYDSELMV